MRAALALIVALVAIVVALLPGIGLSERTSYDEGPAERVLVDLTYRSPPGLSQGYCMQVEPGTLRATIKIADPERGVSPIRFVMRRAGNNLDPSVVTMVATESVTYSIPSEGDLYCYGTTNEAAPANPAGLLDLDPRQQLVSLRLVLAPR